MSDRAPLLHFQRAEAACLMAANLNSIVLDYAARTAIGGTDLSYFIIKQLPVLNPEDFQEKFLADTTYADMIIPRVLELTYTAYALRPFANDLGYDGPPFAWDPERRHRVQCELDAIYAHIYRLDRDELEWILDAPSPSASFPTLKRNELALFGEYRTQRFVLAAYDQIIRGDVPDLTTLS